MRYRRINTAWLIVPLTITVVAATVQAQDSQTPEQLLETALQQDKIRGQIDSTAASYNRILSLHRRGRAQRRTAQRAQMRLDWLHGSRLLTDTTGDAAGDHQAIPDRLDLSATVRQIIDSPLQLGYATNATPAAPPLSVRSRWLAKVAQLGQAGRKAAPPTVFAAVGSAMAAVRRVFGLRGLNHYIEQELRRNGPRPLTAHEQFLSALEYEKQHKDFGGALERYQDVVQLSLTGGIATRLSQRAREGVVRCERLLQTTTAGS